MVTIRISIGRSSKLGLYFCALVLIFSSCIEEGSTDLNLETSRSTIEIQNLKPEERLKQEVKLNKALLDLVRLYLGEIEVNVPEHYTTIIYEKNLRNDTVFVGLYNEKTFPVDIVNCESNYSFFSSELDNDIYLIDTPRFAIASYLSKVSKKTPNNCGEYLPTTFNGNVWSVWIWNRKVVKFDNQYTEVSNKTLQEVYRIEGW